MHSSLDKVKDCDSVPNRRQKAGTIKGEHNIAFAVNCAKKIGKLEYPHVGEMSLIDREDTIPGSHSS